MSALIFLALMLLAMQAPSSVGAQGAPWLVKDICPGSIGSNPTNMVNVNGVLYFVARDDQHGFELWTSNGTEEETNMVKDIASGSGSAMSSLSACLVNVDGTVFFNPTVGSRKQLWKSDGVDTSTILVKDIQPVSMLCVKDKVSGKSRLFLSASDSANGQELWVSDGTTTGTVLVKDIRQGMEGSAPTSLTDADGVVYFMADNGTLGQALWKTDGTPEGTVLIKPMLGTDDTQDRYLIYAGSQREFIGGSLVDSPRLFFVDKDTNQQDVLYCSNGTASGTKPVQVGTTSGPHVINPSSFAVKNSILYFYASDDLHGLELWSSNGSPTGTQMVKDLYTGLDGSYFNSDLTFVKDVLYFMARGDSGVGLYKYDATNGAVKVKSIQGGNLTDVNGVLYFTTTNDQTNGQELWMSDGTGAGTQMVGDLSPGTGSSAPTCLTNVYGTLFFSADVPGKGRELWAVKVEGETGSLLGYISPESAINAGAKWRRKGTTAWLDSGYTETKIPVGTYTVEYKVLKRWVTPANQTVVIEGTPTSYTEGAYQMILGAQDWMSY